MLKAVVIFYNTNSTIIKKLYHPKSTEAKDIIYLKAADLRHEMLLFNCRKKFLLTY